MIGQWAGSGDLLYFPQSHWLYVYYPPAINPWGPGQLDDFSHVRIYSARTDQLFPATYKGGFGAWVSPFVGVGDWESSVGFGYSYTYLADSEHGPVEIFNTASGSRYGLNFTDELAIHYNEPDYGSTFHLDRLQQQADQIVDRTVHPNGSSTSTLDLEQRPKVVVERSAVGVEFRVLDLQFSRRTKTGRNPVDRRQCCRR